MAERSRETTVTASLKLGDLGWTQRANFLVTGDLTLASAVGLRRALRPLGGSTRGPLLVFGGLLQRATVTLGLAWLTPLAVHPQRFLP
jgi:hypothetical protein